MQHAVEEHHRSTAAAAKDDVDPAALLAGLRAAFWTCAGFMLLSAIAVAGGMNGWDMLHRESSRSQDVGVTTAPVPAAEGRGKGEHNDDERVIKGDVGA